MKYYFVSFANEVYYNALQRIKKEAEQFELFDEINCFTNNDLKSIIEFWNRNGNFIENNKRGYGYWIWKPFIVLNTLKKMNDNDILVYCDAGCTLNIHAKSRFIEYLRMTKESTNGILAFDLAHIEKYFTKNDIFEYFNLDNDPKNSKQTMATSFLIKKCDSSLEFVNNWYEIMSNNYDLITDSPSISQNCLEFIDNRHDQSIFSRLCKKYNVTKINDETWHHDLNDKNFLKNSPIIASRKIN